MPFIYRYTPLITRLLIWFSMLLQEHMLKFSACYEFVPVYYLIPLDYTISYACYSPGTAGNGHKRSLVSEANHKTFTQCDFNMCPSSAALDQP